MNTIFTSGGDSNSSKGVYFNIKNISNESVIIKYLAYGNINHNNDNNTISIYFREDGFQADSNSNTWTSTEGEWTSIANDIDITIPIGGTDDVPKFSNNIEITPVTILSGDTVGFFVASTIGKNIIYMNSNDAVNTIISQDNYIGITSGWGTSIIVPGKEGRNLPRSPVIKVTYTTQGNNQIICFPENTPITTDQGIVAIQDLEKDSYTINGSKVLGVVSYKPKLPIDMVLFKQHALGYNMPSKDTLMTRNHQVYYNNVPREAISYTTNAIKLNKSTLKGLPNNPKPKVMQYNREVYNVMLEDGHKMKVNNLLVETLHPSNRLYKSKLNN